MTQYRLQDTPLECELTELLASDPSLGDTAADTFAHEFLLSPGQMSSLFFEEHGLDYISALAHRRSIALRVLTHPRATRTCFEKAALLGKWRALNVIKTLYLEDPSSGELYGFVVPETGCFLERERLAYLIDPSGDLQLHKAQYLPTGMEIGTCSPFLVPEHLIDKGGPVRKVYFDNETLVEKKQERSLDDFSFGNDKRVSLQLNYYHCYQLLKSLYPDTIASEEILGLAFQEVFQRRRGQIKITYDFKSLNYRTAKFVEETHGYGDVSFENDFSDELDLPDGLTRPAEATGASKANDDVS